MEWQVAGGLVGSCAKAKKLSPVNLVQEIPVVLFVVQITIAALNRGRCDTGHLVPGLPSMRLVSNVIQTLGQREPRAVYLGFHV